MHLTYRWRATLVIALGLLMAVLDVTIVSVVLPQIATTLHADYQTSTWIGTGYLLANAAVIPVLLGPAFGPTLGGYLATTASWNAIFLINVPIGVIAFLLALLVLQGRAEEQATNGNDKALDTQRFDWLGLVLAMASFTVLVYSITQAGTDGWGTPTVICELLAGCVLLVAFVLVELFVKDPVLDLRLFRSYTFTIANVLGWVSSAVFFASLFLVPVFFERVENLSALTTGEIVIAQGLAMAVGLAISGRLYNRVGPRMLAVIGAILVTVSMLGFTRLTAITTGADLQLWLIVRGLGLGLFMQPLQTLTVSVVEPQQMARATSLTNSTRTVAGAVGVAVLTSYLTLQTTRHLKEATVTCVAQANQHFQISALHACIGRQAITMGMNDIFFVALIACAVCAVATIFVGRDPALEAAKEARQRGEKVEESTPMTVTP